MSVNPLDLQINFSQVSNVGKQQSLLKESEVLRQEQASELINKKSEKDADDIPVTKDLSEGSEKIKDKERENSKKNNKQSSDDEKDPSEDESEEKKREILKEQNLGQNIDILG